VRFGLVLTNGNISQIFICSFLLADLAKSVSIVRTMRLVTIGPRLLTLLSLAALVPFLPLMLFQYPLAELAQKLIKHLVGL